MKIFTTYYLDEHGAKWGGERITAISHEDAEEQAKALGLTVEGQLRGEVPCDDNYKVDWSKHIDYDKTELN